MPEYRVSWSIDLDSTSPEAAAEMAQIILLEAVDETIEGYPNIFEVTERGDETTTLIEVVEGVGRVFDKYG